jgi:hypothetical protein
VNDTEVGQHTFAFSDCVFRVLSSLSTWGSHRFTLYS